MPIKQEVTIGDCRLILGDCLAVMPTLGRVDSIVTDPPYGIGEGGGRFRDRKGGGHRVLKKKSWDNKTPEKEAIDMMRSISNNQIIWGGNYFTDKLPVSRGWLYWQKLMGGDFSDGELAWTSFDKVLKEFKFCNKFGGKQHPTQKPIELMKWCLEKTDGVVVDPYMGSASTLVACAKMGRKGIGIELDEDYFNIACKRVEDAYKQPDMFVEQPKKKPEQGDLTAL